MLLLCGVLLVCSANLCGFAWVWFVVVGFRVWLIDLWVRSLMFFIWYFDSESWPLYEFLRRVYLLVY